MLSKEKIQRLRDKLDHATIAEFDELCDLAAFALKQKGEVVLEFYTTVEYQPVGMSKIILPWENGEDEELRYKTVHVTITAPKPLEEGPSG